MTAEAYRTTWPRRRESGFTLVEMVVVMAIIAILARVAIPAYRDYVIRGKIPEATGNLAVKRVQMEQWFLDNRPKGDGTGGYAQAKAGASLVCPEDGVNPKDSATSQYFDFSCVAGTLTETTYTLQAVGKDDMAGFTYTLDQSNSKATTNVPSGWSKPSPNNCWVARKGGLC